MTRFNRLLALAALLAVMSLSAAVCSRQSAAPGADSSSQTSAANLAAADMGGAVEALTGTYGPGFAGRALIDGVPARVWKADKLVTDSSDAAVEGKVPYPQEAVFSFYERNAALIGSVAIDLPNPALAPKDVEVWTSMEDSADRYAKVASVALTAKTGEQTISFTPMEARFVKLRIASGASETGLEIAEVKVLEAQRSGYTPLFARASLVKMWNGSARAAAQRGLDWLEQAAPAWAKENKCFGCHVQAQTLMGQAVALNRGYRVSFDSAKFLDRDTRGHYTDWTWNNANYVADEVFAAVAIGYAADLRKVKKDEDPSGASEVQKVLLKTADKLVRAMQKDGSVTQDRWTFPIIQGEFMTTANALGSFKRAAAISGAATYAEAARRGLAWIATHEPETTQDRVFKIIALAQYGTADERRSTWSIVERLTAEQLPDGGWMEQRTSSGSNAFATGQVLYALKKAGVSIHAPVFKRGVEFLLTNQMTDPAGETGSWPAMNSGSERPSAFAHTMWAVIGLAEAFGVESNGALQIVTRHGDKPPTPNLEIVLDVSGSMNGRLGTTTRWQNALDALKKVVDAIPEDHKVGLRVYGHRQAAKSPETCTDTELVVPIEKLDRRRILATASNLKPRGETPLIRSVLETLEDLKAAGGGSVILITDGEESCGGDVKAAAAQFKASGLNLTLNIVGFTITGQETQAELGGLAGATGGRYYSAQDGAQLTRAVMLAALQRVPYEILDQSGRMVMSGETSEHSRELPPGTYRLRMNALGQILEESITITADQTVSLALDVDGYRLVIRR